MDKVLKSKRLDGIGEYYFSQKLRQIEELNKSGRNIINLGIGNPDMEPPAEVQKALVAGLSKDGFHKYQSYKGIPALRKAFTDWYLKYYHVELDPEREVLPLIGSKEGIMHCSMAFLHEGDEALVPNPGYPSYASAVKLAGAKPVFYHLSEENNYLPDLDELEAIVSSNTKVMWVNYPHMPTGTPFSEDLKKLIDFCREHHIILINDNPYSFILTETPTSLLSSCEKEDLVLELNSLSKSHNMQGWRVGVLAGNEKLIQLTLTFKSQMDSGMFRPVQEAAIVALNLEQEWYDKINKVYKKRQEKVFQLATYFNCQARAEQVGMFVWAKIPDHVSNGETYADEIMAQHDLFIPPGMIFGSGGDQFIRFSLCQTEPVWEEVFKRIGI